MGEYNAVMNLPRESSAKIVYKYALYLPNHIRVYDEIDGPLGYDHVYQRRSYPVYHITGEICVPIDLISAARLGLIKPGDDSGVGEEQWAWMKLIGLVGETGNG